MVEFYCGWGAMFSLALAMTLGVIDWCQADDERYTIRCRVLHIASMITGR